MDWLTVGSHGLAFASGVLAKVLGDWWTDSRRARAARATTNERFARIEAAMPALLQEMRSDLSNGSLIREFVVLPSVNNRFSHGHDDRFEYYADQHPALNGKVAMLINSGYVSNVAAAGNYPIYRMTEEFVRLVERM
jgi:hypothetical protein